MQLTYQIVSIGKALLLGLVLPKEVFQMQHLTLLVFSYIPFPFEETMVWCRESAYALIQAIDRSCIQLIASTKEPR